MSKNRLTKVFLGKDNIISIWLLLLGGISVLALGSSEKWFTFIDKEENSKPEISLATCYSYINNCEFDSGVDDWALIVQSGNSGTFSINSSSLLSGTNSAQIDISSTLGAGNEIHFHRLVVELSPIEAFLSFLIKKTK